MNKIFKFLLIGAVAMQTSLSFAAQVNDDQPARPKWAGVWGAWGTERYCEPWLKGSIISNRWRDIEPESGKFDFSKLDKSIDLAIANNQYFIVKVYVDYVPLWIYDNGVPKVTLKADPRKGSHKHLYQPYYLDEDYKRYVTRMWDATQKHIASLPAHKRERFVAFQVPLGRSGDPQPYYGLGPIDEQIEYALPSKGEGIYLWQDYQLEMARKYIALFESNGPFNGLKHPFFNFTEDAALKAIEEGVYTNQKSHMVAQGYHMSGEIGKSRVEQMAAIKSMQGDGSDYIRCRGEFDDLVRAGSPWVAAAPVWHYYWNCNWMLTYGLDFFMQRTITVETKDKHKVAFDYFNDHAGYKDVTKARYAYAALRDDLDVADSERFPEEKYGSMKDMSKRYESVLAEMAPYGARNDDPEAQSVTEFWLYKRKITALNDAVQNVWRGNYGNYLTQIEPNVHDQGYWRVGSLKQPYGRFARGFDPQNGKNNLYFDLHDDFYATQKGEAKKVLLRVIYFAEDKGEWALMYHAKGGSMKEAIKVKNSGKGWQTKEIIVDDALLEGGGYKGADLMLENRGKSQCRFHMVEVERVE